MLNQDVIQLGWQSIDALTFIGFCVSLNSEIPGSRSRESPIHPSDSLDRRFVQLLGDDGELSQHPQGVPIGPFFRDPATRESYDAHSCDRNLLPGRRNPLKLSSMRPRRRPLNNHAVPIRERVLDGEMKVRKGRPIPGGDLPHPIRPSSNIRDGRVMAIKIAREELICEPKVPLIVNLLDDPTHFRYVFLH